MSFKLNPITGNFDITGGPQGPQGNQGPQGDFGGPQGPQGDQGPQGFQGDTGATGAQGLKGDTGSQGSQGLTGNQGNQGYQGSTGNTGATGSQGPQGNQGTRGFQGYQGLTGPQGVIGNTGSQGAQGHQGNQGFQGSKGLNWFGDWDNSNVYQIDSVIYYQGSSYIAIQSNINKLPTNETYWSLVVEKGNQGVQGFQGNTGPQGIIGSQGNQGLKGDKGDTGSQGNQGTQGNQGFQGQKGNTGDTGSQGPQGHQGNQGLTGPQGFQGETGADSTVQGPQGFQGNTGPQGLKGDQGSTGSQGATGSQGPQGFQGSTGSQGDQGNTGADSTVPGPQGPQGNQGHQGLTGADSTVQGPQGYQGDIGETGATGSQGPQGFQGNIGNTGPQGNQGYQGTQGITGSTGPQGNQGDIGETGPQGNQGFQGNTGAQGDIGETGATGPQGNQGTQGNQGNQGTQGTQGYQGNQGLQGETGLTGSQGPQGNQGNQGLIGDTGPQGNQGYQGNQGTIGSQGPQGNQGNQGDVGVGVPPGGTTGQVLKKNSATDYDTSFDDLVAVSVTTKGDLQGHNATVPDRLAVGTDNKVLMADSAETLGLKWADASAVSIVNNEVPSGSINSSNVTFTLGATPVTDSVQLFLNGIRLKITDDYTISGATITMVTAPETGDNFLADYLLSAGTFATGSVSFNNNETPSGTVNSSNVTFTLAQTPVTNSLMLYRDGQLMKGGGADYTLTTNSIAFTTAPTTGSVLLAFYQYAASAGGNADLVDNLHGSDNFVSGSLIADYNGWKKLNVTLAYSSADDPIYVLTSSIDLTSILNLGMKVKFTNNSTTFYGFIHAITSSTITVYGGTDYDVANSAITGVYFSTEKAPFGFILDPEKWRVALVDTTARIQTNATQTTYYNPGSLSVSIPIGKWRFSMQAMIGMFSQNTSGQGQVECALSTANNSVSNAKLEGGFLGYIYTATARVKSSVFFQDIIALTSKTTYYPIIASLQNVGTTDIGFYNVTGTNDVGQTLVIIAECAYL